MDSTKILKKDSIWLYLATLIILYTFPCIRKETPARMRIYALPTNEQRSDDQTEVWSLLSSKFQDKYGSLHLCKAGCSENFVMTEPGSVGFCPQSQVNCFPCDCEQDCVRYGTCCTKIGPVWLRQVTIPDLYELQRQQSQDFIPAHHLRCRGVSETSKDHHLVIAGCGSRIVAQSDMDECEKSDAEKEVSVKNYLYVTDSATSITYKNKACGKCNGVIKAEPWELSINCRHYQRVYTAKNEDELLGLSLRKDSSCDVNQWPPHQSYFTPCNPAWFDDLIDTCNVTGTWEDYSFGVEDLCEKNTPISDRVVTGGNQGRYLFKNIHCMHCNLRREEIEAFDLCNSVSNSHQNGLGDFDRPPFSLLLGLRESRVEVETFYVDLNMVQGNCSDLEWSSPDGECLPLSCSPGKIAKEGQCITALDEIRGLGYTVQLYLAIHGIVGDVQNDSLLTCVSNNATEPNHFIFNKTIKHVFKKLPVESYAFSLSPIEKYDNIYATIEFNAPEKRKCNGQECSANVCLVADKSYERDNAEQQIVEKLVGNINISSSSSCVVNVTHFIIPLSNRTQEKCASNSEQGTFLNSDRQMKWDAIITKKKNNRYGSVGRKINPVWDDLSYFMPLSHTLNCTYVSFPPEKFKLDTIKDLLFFSWKITIEFQTALIEISDPKDLIGSLVLEDGSLRVCHDILDKNTKARRRKVTTYSSSDDKSSTVSFWQSVLNLICMGVSIVCLAATVLTYSLFAALRSSAGWHNLFLSVTLLLAQCLLLASTYSDGPSTWCTILGVATHFTWLSMFCWSAVCCFHMFRVFSAKTRSIGGSTACAKRLSLLKKIAFSAVLPGLVVIVVAVGVTIATDGRDIGYGKQSCYLDSPLLVGVATVLPLGVVTICNVGFFAVAVHKIHSVKKLQSTDAVRKENTQNLYIYIRLSTLTGGCWLFAILAEAVDNDPIRFIYIILNGLQGVFIFISYICNRRVFNLYTGKEVDKKSTSFASSTVNTSSNTVRRDRTETTSTSFSSVINSTD